MKKLLIALFIVFLFPAFSFAGKQCSDPLMTVEKGKCLCPDHYAKTASGSCVEVQLWPLGWPKGDACMCGGVYTSNYSCLFLIDPSGSECLDIVENEGGSITCPADQRGNQSIYDSVLNTCYWGS